ncbi:MAG TPA: recombinase family protein, partial [Steroidobacteraceae bacterium]|nr:recombinase family protein [Steroidobacteraceae bacterium]
GFTEIEIIDEDLGRSAAGTVSRSGFERMVAEVSLGRVGAVAAREVSRFARNSREWQQLVEVCRIVDTVLIDQETVYAPRASNDRLLLGLKGSLNEYELDLLRQRSLEARRAKAKRGELIVIAPVGYRKSEDQRLEKDPDRRVQEAIRLVFDQFERIGSVRQTLLWFLEHGLQLPAATPRGEIHWKRPAYGTLYGLLTNPIYGGAYAYGKTERGTHYVGGEARKCDRRKPRERWLALIPHAHEGYVDWERFERIQRAIHGNLQLRSRHHGPARAGSAVCAGLLRCRRCAAKLTVHYTGSRGDVARYACHRAWLDKGQPRCISFGGARVDAAVAAEVLRVVQPAAIEAAILAYRDEAKKQDEVRGALERDLEAARYAAQRAQRQYDAADPENRLVADELERRWNQALERVREIEQRIAQHSGARPQEPVPTAEEFSGLAERLEELWQHPDTDARLRKRIVRSLIQEVIVDVDTAASEIVLVIHWKGGLHTEVRVPRRRRGQNSTHTAPETLDAVRVLARICPDAFIANVLNRNGLRTGRSNFWTRERVTALRSHHEIPVYSAERRIREGWLNLTEAARLVGVSARTLRLAVERGELAAEHPLADGPWIFNRNTLEAKAAVELAARARARTHGPAIPTAGQGILDLSMT